MLVLLLLHQHMLLRGPWLRSSSMLVHRLLCLVRNALRSVGPSSWGVDGVQRSLWLLHASTMARSCVAGNTMCEPWLHVGVLLGSKLQQRRLLLQGAHRQRRLL